MYVRVCAVGGMYLAECRDLTPAGVATFVSVILWTNSIPPTGWYAI